MHTTRQAISFLMKLIADRVSTLFSLRAEVPLTAAQSRVVMYLEACGGGPWSQKKIEQFDNELYYAKMAAAWCFSICIIKFLWIQIVKNQFI